MTPVVFFSDHFLCHGAKTSPGTTALAVVTGVGLADDIEGKDFDVRKTSALCTPAEADGAGVVDDVTHLHARDIKESAGESPHVKQDGIRLVNALGAFTLDTTRPSRLLVPTAKGLLGPLPPPDPMDHDVDRYKCYGAKFDSGAPRLPTAAASRTVAVADQFTRGRVFLLSQLSRMCTSVDKDGLGRKNPDAHLVCFKARVELPVVSGDPFDTIADVHSSSEFGTEQLDTAKQFELCVPSLRLP